MVLKNSKLRLAIRLLVGLFFIVSAFLKLFSIDLFEIYIYSFGFVDLGTSYLVARFVISFELLAGVLLLLGIYLKKTISASILMLFVFILFIIYLLLSKNDEHCHCFGAIVEVSHSLSIFKNIVLIVFLILVYSKNDYSIKHPKILMWIAILFSFSLPMISSPPDSFYYSTYAKKSFYNASLLKSHIEENKQLQEGKKIVLFFGTSCKYCKLATRKLSIITTKSDSNDKVHVCFLGSEESVLKFYKETNSVKYQYNFLHPEKFLKITNGKMPLIVLLENGEVIKKYNYRSINEQEIIKFVAN